MNIAPFIFVGLLATFSISWFGFVFRSQAQLSKLEPFKDPITSAVYPIARSGLAMQGAEVYRAQGCAACHTQQVRPRELGNDIERGWGSRFTVATDYMLDNPAQLGSVRLGPDLANVGARLPDVNWHYAHLLDPKSKVEKSNMPPYAYLFHKKKVGSGAVGLTVSSDPNFVYVPTDEGRALVAYLLTLRTDGTVFEAPMPRPTTNSPAGDTNAPAATATNAPAK